MFPTTEIDSRLLSLESRVLTGDAFSQIKGIGTVEFTGSVQGKPVQVTLDTNYIVQLSTQMSSVA